MEQMPPLLGMDQVPPTGYAFLTERISKDFKEDNIVHVLNWIAQDYQKRGSVVVVLV